MTSMALLPLVHSQVVAITQSFCLLFSENTVTIWQQLQRLTLLQDYNTRVVLFGTAMLGCAAGVVGVFTLLRKRALMGDAISHATLPGIAISFLLASTLGWTEKSLPLLLTGATITGLLGVFSILTIRNLTKLKEDTALGIVLSVFFGAGVSLLGIIQQMPRGHAAGLESFILGKTATMIASDATLIAIASLICLSCSALLFKELRLLCFDEIFAGSRGYPILALDLVLMTSVVIISIVGLQAVGLIMVVALLVIPAASARFWTDNLSAMTLISAGVGTLSGIIGAAISAIYPRIPSGAMIVLICAFCFSISIAAGSKRGLIVRTLRRLRINRLVERQHFLRTIFELTEVSDRSRTPKQLTLESLAFARTWNTRELDRTLSRACKEGWVTRIGEQISLTKKGKIEAARLTREHRLWELFLIHHADVAPSRVDREADHIEHVLEPEIVAELEALLLADQRRIPQSPHDLRHKENTPSSENEGQPLENQMSIASDSEEINS